MNVKAWRDRGRRAGITALLLVPTLGVGVASASGIVGGAQDPANIQAYWTVSATGDVQGNAGAAGYGGMGGKTLTKPIVGMASDPAGDGYWLVGGDGGVFSFGAVTYYGGLGSTQITGSIVGIAATPDGKGYWLVGSDGKVYPFGDAANDGGYTGGALAKPMVGIAPTPDGKDYWTVAGDGGIFTYPAPGGPFYGSAAASPISGTAVGMAVTPDGKGYWVATSTGAIYPFGDAAAIGPVAGTTFPAPIVAIIGSGAQGFRLIDANGDAFPYGQTTPSAPAPPPSAPTTTTTTTTTPTTTAPPSDAPAAGATTTTAPASGHGKAHGRHRRRPLVVRLTIFWRYLNADTRVARVKVGRLPKRVRLAISCTGEQCSRRHPPQHAEGRKAVLALFARLRGQHYLAGQRLVLTLSVPGRRPERIGVDFRYGKVPDEAFVKH